MCDQLIGDSRASVHPPTVAQATSATGHLTHLGPCADPRHSSPLCCRKCRQPWKGKRRVSCEEATEKPFPPVSCPAPCLTPSYSVFRLFYPQILLFFLISCTSKIFLPLTALSLDGLVWGFFMCPTLPRQAPPSQRGHS